MPDARRCVRCQVMLGGAEERAAHNTSAHPNHNARRLPSPSPTRTRQNVMETLCQRCHNIYPSFDALRAYNVSAHSELYQEEDAESSDFNTIAIYNPSSPTTPRRSTDSVFRRSTICIICQTMFVDAESLIMHNAIEHPQEEALANGVVNATTTTISIKNVTVEPIEAEVSF